MTKQSPTTNKNQSQIPLLLGVVLLIYLAQMTLNTIIAPLAREVGLAEWQVGATISTAALMLVLVSQFWGKKSQSWGRKPVLLLAFVLGMTTMGLFALLAWLGMNGMLAATIVFILFVLFRGIGFGLAISAVVPTAQAYIADTTPDEKTRVKGMAGIGAVQGVSMILGSVVGGILAKFGIMMPIIAAPILLAVGLLLIAFKLRRETHHELIKEPTKIRPTDKRVYPFLLAGFGMFTALGFMQIVAGFLIQDRLGLNADDTGFMTGVVLLAAGLGMILAQAVIVPKSKWSPAKLLRIGTIIALVGFLMLLPDMGLPLLIASMALVGLGMGIAMPGYTAGPTLLVSRKEQGGLAGLSAAVTGLSFIVAPVASTALYGMWHPLPIIIGAAIMTSVVVFVHVHRRFRRLPDAPAAAPMT